MIRIHIVGLPRSGTTALSKAVARALNLPLAMEPIFLWTDGFRFNLVNGKGVPEHGLRRIRENLEILPRVFKESGGFVEKTPSSVFLAPVFEKLVHESIVILISRDREEIIRSLERKIFENEDGNVTQSANLWVHNTKARLAKVVFLFRALGVIEGIIALARYFGWARRNSIGMLSDREEIERFVADAEASLAALDVGETNRVLTVHYARFRSDPDGVLEEVLNSINNCNAVSFLTK